ncbi:MAG TPA: NHL repeat-containing protein [Bryobacteraceae bacterium]|nr:NHL repeat-containing protein [Bryobacteraceae bacterium]
MRRFLVLVAGSCAIVASGCSGNPGTVSNPTNPGPSPGARAAITGKVHGGQNPIQDAKVYLLAVNDTGYGGPGIASSSSNESVSLLTTGAGQTSLGYYVTTDSNGDFTITDDYTCPSAYSHTYLYAVGGNAGSGDNSAITLVGPVKTCPSSSESVVVNEVTTIASVFSFAGFVSDPTHVSSSGTTLAVIGLDIADVALNNLASSGTGEANTTTAAGNGTVPQTTINTLANILAACVNSTGPTSDPCTTLFEYAPNGAVMPLDTATAAVNIAHNPGANVAKLFALQGSSPPFVNDLSSAPNDFTIGIAFTQSSWFLEPHGVAIDGTGDVWVTAFGNGSFPEGGVGELLAETSWSGDNPITGGGLGYGDPQAIAISETVTGNNSATSGDIWVTVNANGTSLIQLGPSGSPTGGCASGCSETGLDGAYYEAIDTSGNGWQTSAEDYEGTNYLFEGVPSVGYSYFSGSCLTEGRGLAIDSSGNIWVVNVPSSGSSYNLCEFSSSGTQNMDSPFSGSGLTEYANGAPIAIDGSNNVWVGADGDVAKFNSSGVLQSPSGGYAVGGVNTPYGIAIDGAGNVWTANNGNNSITELSSTGTAISGSNGFTAGGILNGPNGLAIDGAGNVWVTAGASNNLVEFVGAATPVVTPIAANLVSPYGGHAVNRP